MPDESSGMNSALLDEVAHGGFIMGAIGEAVVVKIPSHGSAVMPDLNKDGKPGFAITPGRAPPPDVHSVRDSGRVHAAR